MRRALRALDRHWFEPARLTDLAALRWLFVATELLLLLWPYLSNSVGVCPGCSLPDQLQRAATVQSNFHPLPALKLLFFPLGWGARPTASLLRGVWWLAVASGVAGLVGLFTRPSLLVFAATNTALIAHDYSYTELHHTEAVFIIALWTLALAPSGARWSLDALRRRRRASLDTGASAPRVSEPSLSPMARWPLRLIQWLLVAMYLSAFMAKLRNSGLAWANGYTLSYFLARDGLSRGLWLGVWLAQHVTIDRLMSVVTLLFEGTFALAVLLPPLAWVYVPVGLALHTGIWVAQGAPFLQIMVMYAIFIPTLRDRWVGRHRRNHEGPAATRSPAAARPGDQPAGSSAGIG